MEIDSDEDEPLPPPVLAPPTQAPIATPTSFSPRPMSHFAPRGFQYPPPMTSSIRQPLPLHTHPIAPPTPYHPVPYSPSMPKLHTPPLTTPPLMPHPFHPLRDDRPLHCNSGMGRPQDPIPPQSHMTPINAPPTFDHSSAPNATPPVFPKTTVDTQSRHNALPMPHPQPSKDEGPDNKGNHDNSKPLPLSLFRDYSDSESDDENDIESRPPTSVYPPTQTSNPPDVTTPTVYNTTPISDQATSTTINNLPPVNHTHPTTSISNHILSEAVTSLMTDNCVGNQLATPHAHVNPENIKITPTLTNLLDQIFPKLSESLKKRRHDNINDDPAHPDETPPPNLKSPRVESTNDLQKFEEDIAKLSKVDNRPPQNHTHTYHSETGHANPIEMGHAPYDYPRPPGPYAPPFRNYPTGPPRMFPSPGMAPPPRHRAPFMSRPHRGRPPRFYQAPPPSMGHPHY